MDPQDWGTRGQPVISMGWAPSPGGFFGLQEASEVGFGRSGRHLPVLEDSPRPLQDSSEASKTAQDAAKTPTRRPKTPQEASKR